MYSIVNRNILLILRSAFFGGMLVSFLVRIVGMDAMLVGLVAGCFCLVLIGVTRILLVYAKNEMAHWIPGRWEDLSGSDFKKIPTGLKIVFLLQHCSVILIAVIFGWFIVVIISELL